MKRLKPILFTLCLSAGAALVVSCNDKIEVQQAYDFSLETMPLKDELFKGETAEIRCKLNREGNYKDATFTIRYFQTDGKGELRMDDGTIFLSNDSYPLNAEQFRLYYTSHCDEQQSIDIYIEDNFGQKKKYTFEWTNNSDDDGVE